MMIISKKTKWSYCVGCLGRDMVFVLVSMFLLAYVQYTMSLTIAQFSAISMIMILSRLWDAVNDPIMGMIIENSRFKKAKFKPWILLGGILNFVVTILLFTVRPEGWAFVVFFGIAYIAWGMSYTINDIAYWSLIPNLSKGNEERNSLTNLVLVFASIGQFLSGGLIPVLVTGNAVMMYKVVGIVISFIFLIFTCITYFGVTENPVENKQQEKVGFSKIFKILFKNDQLVVMAIAMLLHTIASELFVTMALNFFYFEFGYGGSQLTIFTVFFGLGTLSALVVFPLLNKKMSRMKIMSLGVGISVVGYIIFLSLGYLVPMNEIALYFASSLVFFGHSMFFVIVIIMTANTIEYNEVTTGERNEAIIFSVRPFMTKLGAAFQQFILTLVLIISGVFTYSQQIADLEIQKGQGLIGDITQQANEILSVATPEMLLNIRIGMGVIPMLCLVTGYFIIKKRYKISEEKFDEMLIQIETKS